ncbi:MAG: hypothetical protein IJ443_07570 [Firmicutes bacterium]|nr:hypothetical protein [Bacillota bacterium]
MKNLLILMGTIVLGTVIFQMMVGDGPDSLKSTVKQVMMYSISQYAEGDTGR